MPGHAEADKDPERLRIQQMENKLKNLERENELLILQLHQAQEELEAYRFQSRNFFWRTRALARKSLFLLRETLLDCARYAYRRMGPRAFVLRQKLRKYFNI